MERILIVDVECTCVPLQDENGTELSKQWSQQERSIHQNPEIIEVGALLFDLSNNIEIDTFQSFVKPSLNPVLTEFCTSLTTISQQNVDDADGYSSVWHSFVDWCYSHSVKEFASWGVSDLKMFKLEIERYSLVQPFVMHNDLKKAFAKCNKIKPRVGLARAMMMSKIESLETAHRALADCKNTSKLLPFIFNSRIVPSQVEKFRDFSNRQVAEFRHRAVESSSIKIN